MAWADKKNRTTIQNASSDEKRKLTESLTTDELLVYKWLKEGFSLKWTAETLQKGYFSVHRTARRICRKLNVRDVRELVRYYAPLGSGRAISPETLNEEKEG